MKKFILITITITLIYILASCRPILNNNIEVSESEGEIQVHFIDVGQGDFILIQSTNEVNMVIDAGKNVDADKVVSYLKEQNISKIDYVVGTHPHEDHIGGLDLIIDNFDVQTIIMPKVSHNTQTFEDVLLAIKKNNLKITSPQAGSEFDLGDAKFTILAPNRESYEYLNNYSIVLRLVYKDTSFLFTADAETISESEMLQKGFALKSDVLKVGHHGSTTSSSPAFIKAVSPEYAIISVGIDNPYGHPDNIILNRLETFKAEVLRTDIEGTLIFTSDGTDISFKSIKNSGAEKNIIIESIDLTGEIVKIKNEADNSINMTGWKLISERGTQIFYFPDDFILESGETISIASGNASGDLKWTDMNIWNNDVDPGKLYDDKGVLISEK